MLNLLLCIMILCICETVVAQGEIARSIDTCIAKNTGELEDCWAIKVFKNEYQKRDFNKYDGHIVEIRSNVLKYDKQYFIIVDAKESIKTIFELGIIYPTLVDEWYNYSKKNDSTITNKPKSFNLFKGDSLYIANVEEMKFLNPSPQIKRFRFWLYRDGFMNPTVYLFELENKEATKNTGLSGFIEGAKLTFINKGWLVM